MDSRAVHESLETYLRPQTFPVAVRLVSEEGDIPGRSKMPRRDFGVGMAVCQGLAIARRYGWPVAMGPDDMVCPAGALTLGFYPTTERVLDGSFEMPFWGSVETRARIVRNMPMLDYGRYRFIVVAPLSRASFEPQLVLVWGNPAQISRLIQANTLATGEPLASSGFGAFACTAEITKPLLTGECHVTIPGGGERTVAQSQDHEVCFSLPWAKAETIVEGLETTHKAGTRYPVPTVLTYEAEFTPGYKRLMDYLRTVDEPGQ